MKCRKCGETAALELRRHNAAFCSPHFIEFFLKQVREAIRHYRMFAPGRRRCSWPSPAARTRSRCGTCCSRRATRPPGIYLDLGIFEYSVESKAKCEAFAAARGQKLIVERVVDAVGAPIPEVQKVTRRPTCSACGLSKRYLLNRAALEHGYRRRRHRAQPRRRGGHPVRLGAPLADGRAPAAVADAGLDPPQAGAPGEAALPAVGAGDRRLRLPARDRLHRGGVSLRARVPPRSPTRTPSTGWRRPRRGPSTTSSSAFSRRRGPPSQRAQDVTLTECIDCGQVTTGEICAFCKLSDQVRRRTGGGA